MEETVSRGGNHEDNIDLSLNQSMSPDQSFPRHDCHPMGFDSMEQTVGHLGRDIRQSPTCGELGVLLTALQQWLLPEL
jgi:hypothetical protein